MTEDQIRLFSGLLSFAIVGIWGGFLKDLEHREDPPDFDEFLND